MITINNADLISPGNFIKSVDNKYVDVGDILTYTLNIKNTGNVAARNIVITDILPDSTSFILGSINSNVPFIGSSLITGISLTNQLIPGDRVTISYKATVTKLTIPNIIENKAHIEYSFNSNHSMTNVSNQGGDSPAVYSLINTANLITPGTFLNEANKSFYGIGEIITYTITLINKGNVPANNVFINDTPPLGSIFVPGSITSTSSFTGNDLIKGINLSDPINPGQPVNLTFKSRVVSIPFPNIIKNKANVEYTYTVNPNSPNSKKGIGSTPDSNVTIYSPDLTSSGNFLKSADKKIADIGDIITYTLTLKNAGNTAANNILITDILPDGTKLVDGSITSPSPFTGLDLINGIRLTNPLNVGDTVIITFKATIINLVSSLIENSANAYYIYTSDPRVPNGTKGSASSNKLSIQINHGEINIYHSIKTANINETTPGDTITYTISLTNTGTVDVDNVLLKDSLPKNVDFIPKSVSVDGIPKPYDDPSTGIHVGTIYPTRTVTIKFKINVLENSPNPLENTGKLSYSYISDPIKAPIQIQSNTTTTLVEILYPHLTISESIDAANAIIGDTIRYTINSINDGQLDLTIIKITDLLPPSLEFIGNLTVDGVPHTSNINNGVNIGTLTIGNSKKLSFDAKVISRPSNGTITTSAIGNFNYSTILSSLSGTSKSNTVDLRVFSPLSTITKTVDKAIVKVEDIFTYTITYKNTGDIDINDVIINDNLPPEFNIINIYLDGVSISGDIRSGLNIGTVTINESKIILVTIRSLDSTNGLFKNIINSTGNIITSPNKPPVIVASSAYDKTGITVFKPSLSMVKSSNKEFVLIDEIITYTIIAVNDGDILLDDIYITDLPCSSIELIEGSIAINGIKDSSLSIVKGIALGSLDIKKNATISFDAKVLSTDSNPISNLSKSFYKFTLPEHNPQFGHSESNKYKLIPEISNIIIDKTSDKSFAMIGDIITYTVKLTNTGTLDATNILFRDILPPETELVPGSFMVDGNVIDSVILNAGVNIGNIKVKSVAIVKYSVKLLLSNCSMKIVNSVSLSYKYNLPNGSIGSTKINGKESVIDLAISNFTQLNIEEYFTIPPVKPNIECINNTTASIEDINYHVIEAKVTTLENQTPYLGYKLVISGIYKELVEYTACDSSQSVHSTQFETPFSTFITLPSSYYIGAWFEVKGIIEDIYNNLIDCRTIFSNATVLIDVKILLT